MADLSTRYLGMELKNPLVSSASPFSKNVDGICRMEEAGASAVVMHSLFEEQIQYDSNLLNHTLEQGTEAFAESLSYLPDMEHYSVGPEHYLETIQKAKEKVNIPIIASLNGTSIGGWVEYAKKIEEAGADALELNIYHLPTNNTVSGSDVDKAHVEIVSAIRKHVSIPLAVKLSPFISSIPHLVHEIEKAKADGIVIFNRFYQADINLEELEVTHQIHYSSSEELLLPLRWTAILSGQTKMNIAVTTGIHTHEDIVKSIMAGAHVTMMASCLLKNGVGHLGKLLKATEDWLEEHEYASVEEMRGSMSLRNVENPERYERAQYLRVLDSYRMPA